MGRRVVRTIIVLACMAGGTAQSPARVPEFGAQVWIEPGQTPEEIDGWFQTLEQSHMPVARLFLMWSYLQPKPGVWDWSLYDAAFRAAERHHIAIVATLTPSGPPAWMGGDDTQGIGVAATEAQRAQAAIYIDEVVERYRKSPALDTWLLLNEPGQAATPLPLALAGFPAWLERRYSNVDSLNHTWGSNYLDFTAVKSPAKATDWNTAGEIDWTAYWREFQTAQLEELAAEVRRHDAQHPLHLNPHALIGNLAALSDDLPAWRSFLDSLGCSIHPAWHFSLLPRDQFALGVSYINDLVDGAIAPKPHWVTELQGGNNIHSGSRPMEPTADDTAQWLWTAVGAGAERTIFWLLNARRSGREAGEWSLLDFDQRPSKRMQIAAQVAETVQAHADFFSKAQPDRPDVTLLLSLQTMTYQLAVAEKDDVTRDCDQQVVELLGVYKALALNGPPPRVKHFDDYDWTAPGEGRTVIVPDARVITAAQFHHLLEFAQSGGTLVLTGLSGLYDEHGKMLALEDPQPLAQVTGAGFKEVHTLTKEFKLPLPGGEVPSRMWLSSMTLRQARAIAMDGGETVASQREFAGGGRVVWVPSPVGAGAWMGDAAPLASFLRRTIPAADASSPFSLDGANPACLLRVMRSDDAYLTILANQSEKRTLCRLSTETMRHTKQVWGSAHGSVFNPVQIDAYQTRIDLWGRRE